MIRLCELKARFRRPLTKLLHEAVAAYYDLLAAAGEGLHPTNGCFKAGFEPQPGNSRRSAIQRSPRGVVRVDEPDTSVLDFWRTNRHNAKSAQRVRTYEPLAAYPLLVAQLTVYSASLHP